MLTLLVGGMIAHLRRDRGLGVGQTWLSNIVGQRVMHDLRAAVYRHLQRLSLAFFTRTRTGEVQSRISNDIGGIDTVVTNDRHLDRLERDDRHRDRRRHVPPRLAARPLLARAAPHLRLPDPARRQPAARIATTRQETLADMSSLVSESLSVSGIMLGKTMGQSGGARGPLRHESRASSPASRCASGWRGAG